MAKKTAKKVAEGKPVTAAIQPLPVAFRGTQVAFRQTKLSRGSNHDLETVNLGHISELHHTSLRRSTMHSRGVDSTAAYSTRNRCRFINYFFPCKLYRTTIAGAQAIAALASGGSLGADL